MIGILHVFMYSVHIGRLAQAAASAKSKRAKSSSKKNKPAKDEKAGCFSQAGETHTPSSLRRVTPYWNSSPHAVEVADPNGNQYRPTICMVFGIQRIVYSMEISLEAIHPTLQFTLIRFSL
jgi:hypothetical protein